MPGGVKPKAKKVSVNDNNSNNDGASSKMGPDEGKSKKSQPKRPKSRIAANFGGAQTWRCCDVE